MGVTVGDVDSLADLIVVDVAVLYASELIESGTVGGVGLARIVSGVRGSLHIDPSGLVGVCGGDVEYKDDVEHLPLLRISFLHAINACNWISTR
jgi:hypothetical protein